MVAFEVVFLIGILFGLIIFLFRLYVQYHVLNWLFKNNKIACLENGPTGPNGPNGPNCPTGPIGPTGPNV